MLDLISRRVVVIDVVNIGSFLQHMLDLITRIVLALDVLLLQPVGLKTSFRSWSISVVSFVLCFFKNDNWFSWARSTANLGGHDGVGIIGNIYHFCPASCSNTCILVC